MQCSERYGGAVNTALEDRPIGAKCYIHGWRRCRVALMTKLRNKHVDRSLRR